MIRFLVFTVFLFAFPLLADFSPYNGYPTPITVRNPFTKDFVIEDGTLRYGQIYLYYDETIKHLLYAIALPGEGGTLTLKALASTAKVPGVSFSKELGMDYFYLLGGDSKYNNEKVTQWVSVKFIGAVPYGAIYIHYTGENFYYETTENKWIPIKVEGNGLAGVDLTPGPGLTPIWVNPDDKCCCKKKTNPSWPRIP